jgi:hypothetical protein
MTSLIELSLISGMCFPLVVRCARQGQCDPDVMYQAYCDGKKHFQNPHLQVPVR